MLELLHLTRKAAAELSEHQTKMSSSWIFVKRQQSKVEACYFCGSKLALNRACIYQSMTADSALLFAESERTSHCGLL